MRVLVVDDSRTMRRIIRKELAEMKSLVSEILEAEDGMEALALLRNEHLEIDLVLLDWNMPRLDGIGFLKSLKSLSPFREVAVIMVTSQAQRPQVAEALRWGVKDYIVKPFAQDTFREKLEKISVRVEAKKSEDTSVMIRTLVSEGPSRSDDPFMERLPDTLIGEFFVLGTLAGIDAGAIVLERGQRVDAFHVCAKGLLEVVSDRPGAEVQVIREGDCFAVSPFLLEQACPDTVRARHAARVLTLSRTQMTDLIRTHPKLGYLLSSLVSRYPGHLPGSPDVAAARADLSGRLDAMSLSDVVQILHISRKSGHLRLDRRQERGGLFFDDGSMTHAWVGETQGEDAFFRLMSWTDADFAFDSGARSAHRSIRQPTMSLLLEGMRQFDESRRSREGA